MTDRRFRIDRSGLVYALPRFRDYILHSGEGWRWLIGLGIVVFALWLYPVQSSVVACCASGEVVSLNLGAKIQTDNVVEQPEQLLKSLPVRVQRGMAGLLIIIGSWILLWRFLRWWLWSKLYSRGLADLVELDDNKPRLLPSQRVFVDRMRARLEGFSMSAPGPLWAIKGSWGSGKSFLMNALHRELEGEEKLAVVYMHVWREQSEADLHLAMVDAILSHPKILRNCFHLYPNRVVIRSMLHSLKKVLPRGFLWKNGAMEAMLDPERVLPLSAQRELEIIIAGARLKNLRVVMVLDEIDRASAAVAQAALLLTRRALGLPGLGLVLPYVGDQLREKVFNPLHDYSPDLQQTMLTQLELLGTKGGTETDWKYDQQEEPGGLVWKLALGVADKSPGVDNQSPKAGYECLPKPNSHVELRRLVRDDQLLLKYLKMPEKERQLFLVRSEEKYLTLRDNIPPLSADDIVPVMRFDTVIHGFNQEEQECLRKVCPQDNALKFGKAVINSVKRSFKSEPGNDNQKSGDDAGDNLTLPLVRHFEGRLAEYAGSTSGYDYIIFDPPGEGKSLDVISDAQTDTSQAEITPFEIKLLCVAAMAWRSAQFIRANKE